MWHWLQHWRDVLAGRPRRLGDRLFGDQGEAVAESFLQRAGMRILARNVRNRGGEIDLIARDNDTVVFVEVKTRRSADHGGPEAAITADKQRRLTRAALVYLKRHGWLEHRARFDVLSLVWAADCPEPRITHYRDAFPPVGRGQMYS